MFFSPEQKYGRFNKPFQLSNSYCFCTVAVYNLTTCPYVYEKYVPLPFDFE